jgi:hypothetical protein
LAGAVTTAIKEIAKALITNEGYLAQICATSAKAIEIARGNLMKGQGAGYAPPWCGGCG